MPPYLRTCPAHRPRVRALASAAAPRHAIARPARAPPRAPSPPPSQRSLVLRNPGGGLHIWPLPYSPHGESEASNPARDNPPDRLLPEGLHSWSQLLTHQDIGIRPSMGWSRSLWVPCPTPGDWGASQTFNVRFPPLPAPPPRSSRETLPPHAPSPTSSWEDLTSLGLPCPGPASGLGQRCRGGDQRPDKKPVRSGPHARR